MSVPKPEAAPAASRPRVQRWVRAVAHALVHELRLVAIALQFLTRVPVPARVGFEPAWLHASARHFPLVGALVGAVGAAVWWGVGRWWSPPVAAGLALTVTLVLTGGFHEDGLADTFDGLGGSVARERALQIMKDSRLGSYGALALLVVLGLKVALLAGLGTPRPAPVSLAAWVWAHTASRAAAVALLRALPYAGDVAHAKAKPMAQQVSRTGLAVALAWPLLGAVLLVAGVGAPMRGVLVSMVAIGAVALLCARWFARRLGGYTGDTLGATQQLSELAALLAWSAAA